VLDPLYTWNNGPAAPGTWAGGVAADETLLATFIQPNRDYYLSARPGYSPFTYPHPLVAGGGAGSAPAITSAGTASGTVGSSFSYTITGTNSPTSFTASPLLAGLSVNTSSGVISGTPTAAGTINVTIGATNATGTGSSTLVLTINPVVPPSAATTAIIAH
jgi:hypothetical protein